jgi:hypothetical protein
MLYWPNLHGPAPDGMKKAARDGSNPCAMQTRAISPVVIVQG